MKIPKVYVVINQKGGVGKTTTSINLTAGLTLSGKRVLGIDLDPQGHYSKFLGVIVSDEQNTILELMKKEAEFEETVVKTQYGDIIPADNGLSKYLMELAADTNAQFAIKDWLDNVIDNYDFVVIDCPPAINHFTVAALIAGDRVIIPTEAEYLSVDGVAMIADSINAAKKRLNPDLKTEGILLVKHQQKRALTQDIEEFLEAIAIKQFDSKVFKTKIRCTVDIPQSQGFRQSVYEYSPKSKGSIDYAAFVKEIIGGNNNG